MYINITWHSSVIVLRSILVAYTGVGILCTHLYVLYVHVRLVGSSFYTVPGYTSGPVIGRSVGALDTGWTWNAGWSWSITREHPPPLTP